LTETTKEESFNEIFGEAVDAAFASLGESAKGAVYWYITRETGVEKKGLASHVEVLAPALEAFFQKGSTIIEMMILQQVSSRTGIVLPKEQYGGFVDAVSRLSKAYDEGPRIRVRLH